MNESNIVSFVENHHRLVHLDLKGAPPKISYLKELFPLLYQYGATGLLVEYEDTFPYRGDLQHLRKQPDLVPPSDTVDTDLQDEMTKAVLPGGDVVEGSAQASCETLYSMEQKQKLSTPSHADLPYYTEEDVAELLASASENNLIVIPLLQTFGHMEYDIKQLRTDEFIRMTSLSRLEFKSSKSVAFVLKHRAHSDLREAPMHPSALCARHLDSLALVQRCVEQVLAVHPGITHLHLGMDEVLVGACQRCQVSPPAKVYLEWAVKVCGWLRRAHPGVTPIIWDDMIRSIPTQYIEASGIGSLTDVMVWKYDAAVLQFPDHYLPHLSRLFRGVWFASAYKGATGAAQCLVPVQHHVDNHLAWLRVLTEHNDVLKDNFRGFALTGWQRYDHFAILCELLPAAVPSLLLCLRVLLTGHFTAPLHKEVSQALGCSQLLRLHPLPSSEPVEETLQFPGHDLYTALHLWVNFCSTYHAHSNSEIMTGWYHQHRRRLRLVSCGVLQMVKPLLVEHVQRVWSLRSRLQRALLLVYDAHTTQEWLQCFVQPLQKTVTRDWQEWQQLERCDTSSCSAQCGCRNKGGT